MRRYRAWLQADQPEMRLRPLRSQPNLADLAVEAAMELGQMPGLDTRALQPTIKFWTSVRDQSSAAALACVGANHTLAGALVAFRLLRNIGGEETDNHAK